MPTMKTVGGGQQGELSEGKGYTTTLVAPLAEVANIFTFMFIFIPRLASVLDAQKILPNMLNWPRLRKLIDNLLIQIGRPPDLETTPV